MSENKLSKVIVALLDSFYERHQRDPSDEEIVQIFHWSQVLCKGTKERLIPKI
jgi:hypothetical protein